MTPEHGKKTFSKDGFPKKGQQFRALIFALLLAGNFPTNSRIADNLRRLNAHGTSLKCNVLKLRVSLVYCVWHAGEKYKYPDLQLKKFLKLYSLVIICDKCFVEMPIVKLKKTSSPRNVDVSNTDLYIWNSDHLFICHSMTYNLDMECIYCWRIYIYIYIYIYIGSISRASYEHTCISYHTWSEWCITYGRLCKNTIESVSDRIAVRKVCMLQAHKTGPLSRFCVESFNGRAKNSFTSDIHVVSWRHHTYISPVIPIFSLINKGVALSLLVYITALTRSLSWCLSCCFPLFLMCRVDSSGWKCHLNYHRSGE